MSASRRRLVVGIGLLCVAIGGWVLRRWLGRLADPVGLAIRATIILAWVAFALELMWSWWRQWRRGEWSMPPLSEGRPEPPLALGPLRPPPLWHAPLLVCTSGLGLLLLLTGQSELLVALALIGPWVCALMWENWRRDRADRARWRTQVRERHERAVAAGAGIALPRRIAKIRPDLVRQCQACAEMHALQHANPKISFTQAEAIVERQIVLGLCPPHAAWRDE